MEIFARRALVPDGGGAYLLSRIPSGRHKARSTCFGDDSRAPPRTPSARLGLVRPASRARRRAARRGTEPGPSGWPPADAGLRPRLQINQRSTSTAPRQALELEAAFQDINMTTTDGQEGSAASSKRRPLTGPGGGEGLEM